MVNSKYFIFIFLALQWFDCKAFEKDEISSKDSVQLPYRKGPWMAGLSGNLKSISLDRIGSQRGNFSISNEYDFQLLSGKFIAKKFVIGLIFSATRTDYRQLSHKVSETFSIGPFVRYYLSKNPSGSMFLIGGVLYGQLVESTKISTPQLEYDSEIFGRGPGIFFGLGYTHFLTQNIGLDVLIRYDYFRFNAEFLDNTINSRTFQTIDAVQSFFGFGFIIIIPEFVF